ncbi:hypothetical protein ABXT08_18955 [Chryseobacterium sp. NRRL B-14859]|uniref:hypothetical protein n=1 Tax=Chryseobacterium sp. NRRL B-14859 TaxID=1562763 RepID=UPI0033912969
MKTIKKVISIALIILAIALLAGYLYFNEKFTPEKNYLSIENESGAVPIKWLGNDKNVLLLPVKFPKDSIVYYLQFDTGAAYTEFYNHSIQHVKGITIHNDHAASTFYIGETKISSEKIKVTNTGRISDKNDSVKIIGTLGADILEDRKTIINLKKSFIVFNLIQTPAEFQNHLIDFKFKKRKIIIQGILRGKEEKFLYDSGTSAYELLTNKTSWETLRLPDSTVTTERAQSRPTILTTYSAKSNSFIYFESKQIPLTEVTYVEGFSQTQYMLMKFSGMTGMLGNKIFFNNVIYIDCMKEKMSIQ